MSCDHAWNRHYMCTLSRVKRCFAVIFSYVLMLLGIGQCYPNVPPSSPLIRYADRSEQTGCEDSKWLSWHGSLISSSISYSHFESSSVPLEIYREAIEERTMPISSSYSDRYIWKCTIANGLVHRTPCKLKYCTNKLRVDVKNAIRLQSDECYQTLSCLTIRFSYLSLKEHRHLAGHHLRLPVQLISCRISTNSTLLGIQQLFSKLLFIIARSSKILEYSPNSRAITFYEYS